MSATGGDRKPVIEIPVTVSKEDRERLEAAGYLVIVNVNANTSHAVVL